jgi:hypothetical protein
MRHLADIFTVATVGNGKIPASSRSRRRGKGAANRSLEMEGSRPGQAAGGFSSLALSVSILRLAAVLSAEIF